MYSEELVKLVGKLLTKSELGDGSAEELKEKVSRVLEHWLELAQLQEKERL